MDELPVVEGVDSDLPGNLELGAFSVSLDVADLGASKRFYEALGFVATGGSEEHNYLILKNGATTIGLFEAMLGENILTFNPGLTERMERVERYTDVRSIQAELAEKGIEFDQVVSAEAGERGPAHISLTDPDGNKILIDQFFD